MLYILMGSYKFRHNQTGKNIGIKLAVSLMQTPIEGVYAYINWHRRVRVLGSFLDKRPVL